MASVFRMRFGGPFVPLLLAVWLAVVGYGFNQLLLFAYTPGSSGAPLTAPPPDGRPDDGRLFLMMFIHPHCDCSSASIDQLAGIMAAARGRMAARVYFYWPAGTSLDWAQSELWQTAAAIPNTQLVVDDDGSEAIRFHALVSGDTRLYGADGTLIFSGGITNARGHRGNSIGREAILAHVDGQPFAVHDAPVYGCYIVPDLSGR